MKKIMCVLCLGFFAQFACAAGFSAYKLELDKKLALPECRNYKDELYKAADVFKTDEGYQQLEEVSQTCMVIDKNAYSKAFGYQVEATRAYVAFSVGLTPPMLERNVLTVHLDRQQKVLAIVQYSKYAWKLEDKTYQYLRQRYGVPEVLNTVPPEHLYHDEVIPGSLFALWRNGDKGYVRMIGRVSTGGKEPSAEITYVSPRAYANGTGPVHYITLYGLELGAKLNLPICVGANPSNICYVLKNDAEQLKADGEFKEIYIVFPEHLKPQYLATPVLMGFVLNGELVMLIGFTESDEATQEAVLVQLQEKFGMPSMRLRMRPEMQAYIDDRFLKKVKSGAYYVTWRFDDEGDVTYGGATENPSTDNAGVFMINMGGSIQRGKDASSKERFSFYGIEFETKLDMPVCDEIIMFQKVCYVNMAALGDDATSGLSIKGRGFENVIVIYPEELMPAFSQSGGVSVSVKNGVVFRLSADVDVSRQKEIFASLKQKMGEPERDLSETVFAESVAPGAVSAMWVSRPQSISVPVGVVYIGEEIDKEVGKIIVVLSDGQYMN